MKEPRMNELRVRFCEPALQPPSLAADAADAAAAADACSREASNALLASHLQ